MPQIVSLGPYHHGRRVFREMERHKWRFLHKIVNRTNHDVKAYLNCVKELEKKARACYEGIIALSSEEFVEMMVLDGCFILEFFRGVAEGFINLGYSQNDPVFAIHGFMHSIQRDMIMLENQIPLCILDHLLGLQIGKPHQRDLVSKLAMRFFDPLMPTDESLRRNDQKELEPSLGHISFDPLLDNGGLHCLDVFRKSLLRTGLILPPRKKSQTSLTPVVRIADKRN
ncbi:hypothetical protein GIB67_001267 [Kingdonia uniflora]|uniref:Uncharacterized protein n=1 Tax=Kingdonia uniflora TaxID=39325 RepID=A0A7J7LHQ7_9MAGN|nr:hypothetical protein GIB67_001267 [Kingdonia uniflora]